MTLISFTAVHVPRSIELYAYIIFTPFSLQLP